MANSYVLFDLESIKVNTRTINNKPIVFCKSITIKQREQDIASVEDWSNIIIGDPNITRNIGENGTITIEISNLLEKNGEYDVEVNTNIGLWSVILFKTITDDNGEYTTLYNIADESANIGGTGVQGTNIEVIYKNDPTYTNNKCVNNFLENVFVNTEDYNGCMFINNGNCGLFLNISPIMFNTQSNLKDIVLTNTITYIDSNKSFAAVGVFSDCINLESANIPKYLDDYFEYSSIHNEYNKRKTSRSIPTYYFYNCNKLNNITIPDGIRTIGYAAFYGCDNVETINIPESVTSIETLSLVTVNRSDKRYINVNGNGTSPSNIMIYEQSVGYDTPNPNNGKYTTENDVIIKINDRDVVTLQGPLMFDNSSFVKNTSANSEIYINCNAIKGTTLNTNNYGQQKYGGGFVNTKFKTIYIGPKVTSICDFAFYNVIGTNLIIDNGNVLAKNYTDNSKEGSLDTNGYGDGTYLIKTPFANSNFNSIHVLNCASIGQYALHSLYTTELKFFELNYNYVLNNNEYKNTTSLESLGEHAFYNSTFGSIIIPSTVNSINETTFLQTKGSLELKCNISGYSTTINQTERKHIGILVNSGFSEINFNYEGSIPKYILYENKSIKSIYLGENIKTISEKAFYLCTSLTNILSLPSSLQSIHETSFIGCTFSKFEADSSYFKTSNNGMYLLTGDSTGIVLFANKHSDIQITDNTFNIDIDINTVNKICGYALAYAFSDYANSNVYAVNIPENIKNFGSNVFYNSNKLTRITFFSSNIPDFNRTESADNIKVHEEETSRVSINTKGSFIELPLLKDVYIGYAADILLSDSFVNNTDKDTWFLHNTLRNSYTNTEPDISKITIYVYENLFDEYESSMWKTAGYTIVGIPAGVNPPPPVPPTGNDDSYDADIDDPEGEEWPNDGGNGDITEDEDHIPPVDDNSSNNEEGTDDSWITHENNVFKIPIKQLGTPDINVYGCRLDLLNPTYLDGHEPLIPPKIIDQFGNIDFSALDYLKFNKVSNETHYGSDNDNMLKLYMGDYGNNFLVVFTVTGIDKFDATTKLFTSGVEYATHRESNWLKTEIVRITKKPESNAYYVVLLCTCLKLQNKDNYNCRTAIVSVNYGSQILDSSVNGQNTESITTKIRVIQHKTELRLSNDTREINITDLPILFCQTDERTDFFGYFFIGFPKNFWGIGNSINNIQKLREYINDYFRILYDKEKIQIVGQVVTIDEIEYTYTFDVAPEKYANIKATGSTTGVLTKFSLCEDKLGDIHEEYYYVNFKIKNKKTTLAGGVWNISIYNIGEPAEMLNIHVIEDKTDIPSIVLFDENVSVYGKRFNGTDIEEDTNALSDNVCHSIYGSSYVALNYFIPVAITNLPIVSNTFIYPDVEVVDLCVDSSCIVDCGNEDNTLFGTGGGNLFNNYRGVLTLNTNSTTQPKTIFPISSSKLKHLALSNIKYAYNKNIQNTGLYSYFKNSATAITNCSCTKNITKINRTGSKDDSDILENTTTFLYEFNTGVSCINQIIAVSKTALYSHFLSINGNTINFTEINDSNSKIAYHDETYVRENNLCFNGNKKIIYDKFYNVLTPFYPYSEYTTKYKTNDSSEAQILVNNYQNETHVKLIGDSTATIYKNTLYTYINNDSEITATGPTYYCTSTPCIVITTSTNAINEDNFNIYTGQAYLVTDASNAKINIGFDTSTEDYTKESTNNTYMNTSIYSNASTVTLHPLYTLNTDSITTNVHSQLTSTLIENACVNAGITLRHGLVISVIRKMDITFTPNNTSDLIVYEKINNNGSSEYYNINNEKINKNTLYTCSTSNIGYDKWVYISDSSASSFPTSIREFYYNEVFSNGSNVVLGEFNKMADKETVNDIPAHKTFDRGDSIYNTDGGNINKTPAITPTPFTTNSLNIGNLILSDFDKSVDQTRFRQIFLNFYYSILDNGVKTKVYADNTDGILMHLRLINKYKLEPLSVSFTATNINIFNFSFNSTSNDIFTGLQTTIPSYPSIKL